MKPTEVTLAQANALTQAKYDFKVVEKRAIYHIIKEVRRQFIDREDGQKDLFQDLVVSIQTKDLRSSEMSLREVYSSLMSLRTKSILIEDEERILEVGYINYFEHKRREPFLEVQVSKKILPYLVELAGHFTTYSLAVAISLKTKYSQRFYEFCSQFKNTGFFYITIDELREKLKLKESYDRYSSLRKYVIDAAQKELKELYDEGQCDIYFNYSEEKLGRSVKALKIVVVSSENEGEKPKLEDFMYFIKSWLSNWLNTGKKPKNKAWVDKVVSHLNLNPDLIPKLYTRLEKMQEKSASTSYAALARHIIEEDYLD